MTRVSRPFVLLLFAALAFSAPGLAAKTPSKKSPHAQIVAVCRVETAPAERVHKNQRRFLEFDVTIVSFTRVPGDADASDGVPIRRDRTIHVVHDLSCGGAPLALLPGDAVEIRGEYV